MVADTLEQAPADENAIVTRLVDSYEAAKERQATAPDAYQPGAGWRTIVESEWAEVRAAIHRRDIAAVAGFLRNFFRNEGANGFWGGARTFERFVASDESRRLARAAQMQRQIDAWRTALPTCPITELDVPRIGNPWGFVIDGSLLYEPVCEYHHQAHYFESLLHDLAASAASPTRFCGDSLA